MDKKIDLRKFWLQLWQLMADFHRQTTSLVFLSLVEELVLLLGPYFLKIIIDLLTDFRKENVSAIALWAGAMFVTDQLASFIRYFNDVLIFRILAGSSATLMVNAQKKMLFLDLGYHAQENTGGKIYKIQNSLEKIRNLLGSLFWEVLPTVFQFLFTMAALFWIDWRFGAVVAILGPLFYFVTLVTNRRAFPLRRSMFDQGEKAASLMGQAIININTVKSFVQEEKELSTLEKVADKMKRLVLDTFAIILRSNIQRNLIIDLGRLTILGLGVYLAYQERITLGSLVFVYTISEKALISLYRISRLYDQIMESSEGVFRLYGLSQEKPTVKNPKNGIQPERLRGQIDFADVSFTYSDSGTVALEKIQTRIQPGKVTALVGPSGGGKTTLARMLYRHYDPTEGAVLLDGQDLRRYDLYAFRRQIAIVPQEVDIFNLSVRENIAYGKPDASEKDILSAAAIANADEFINNLKDGYETIVGERGIKLSGGQRQRIGIARAVLSDPAILVFDEATSNLDSQSERLIQQAMEKIGTGRTMIIIAHRLSTIRKADKIIVLEKGRIVQEGSHQELASTEGSLYRKLIDLQKMGDVG